MRGPLVYCFESVDNPRVELSDAKLMAGSPTEENDSGVGAVALRFGGAAPTQDLSRLPLYTYTEPQFNMNPCELVAVPYYLWGNRGPSQMKVWI
jgi:DUF1680 family protein